MIARQGTSWRCGAGSLDARADRGSVTLFLAIAVIGLLALAGLVVDGGAKVRAAQRADRLAAEAARAAGQAVDVAGVLQTGHVRVDRRAALAAAQSYLRSAGVEGSAEVSQGGGAVTVRTRATVPTVFLGLVGVSRFTVQGVAEVSLVHQLREEIQ